MVKKGDPMLSKSLRMMVLLLCVFITAAALADDVELLKKHFVVIKGWKTGEAEGARMEMGGMTIITANKKYKQGNKSIDVVIMIGQSAMVNSQSQAMKVETGEGNFTVEDIDGFKVGHGYDKEDKSGFIFVGLAEKGEQGAMIGFSYENLTRKQAMEIARNFNWKKIKATVLKLMK
jgi:hypothetical protein